MSVPRPHPTEEQWLAQRAFIRYKYLVEDTSLQDLVSALASRGFDATSAFQSLCQEKAIC